MNNDMKLYSSNNLREETADEMRNALRLIAKEVQRFRLEFEAGRHKINDDYKDIDEREKDRIYSAKFHTKNKQLKKLKENLKAVCNVAKIVLSAKNRETSRLISNLNEIRNEASVIRNSNAQNLSSIQKLQIENHNIHNDVQLLCNFIHLGYEKLQRMRNETPKYVSSIEELKAILLACGQYYAEYCNARDHCEQLERKNRFLKNKLNIVENNLAATSEELRNLRSQNMKLRIKFGKNHTNRETMTENMKNPNLSELVLEEGAKSNCDNTVKPNPYTEVPNRSIYITSHLEAVKNLIVDQDHMLKELKELYLEIHRPVL